MLKVDLHAHTDEDPLDVVAHSARTLIERAAALRYDALAITLHNRYRHPPEIAAFARERGVVLIPGIERSIHGRHVLLINFPAAAEAVRTFDDIAALKRSCPAGLVIAPHPFFPIRSALGRELERHPDVFDAVEVNSVYTRAIDFNRQAVRWAARHGKPLVGNTDLHLLDQLGTTYTLVDAPADADAICAAIRAGRCDVKSEPLSMLRAGWIFGRMVATGLAGRVARLAGRRR